MKEQETHPRLPLWVELLGWYGAGAILGAYLAVSFAIVSPEGIVFQALNLTGAGTLLLVSWRRRMMQTVFLNTIWVLIALVAIGGIFL
jgi:hypothetical protein